MIPNVNEFRVCGVNFHIMMRVMFSWFSYEHRMGWTGNFFSGYSWYIFHNKTQIKNFRFIHFAQLTHHQDHTGLYDCIDCIIFFICVLLWNIDQAYPEKRLCTMFHLPPSSTSIKYIEQERLRHIKKLILKIWTLILLLFDINVWRCIFPVLES